MRYDAMPSLFDACTLLALLAPVALPRLVRLLTLRQRKQAPPLVWQHQQQPVDSSRLGDYWQTLLLAALVVHSALRLSLRAPFDVFSSLQREPIPLNIASSRLGAALQWHNLTHKHGHVLPWLTSLDNRLLYKHFGQDTFVAGHQLLGSATAKHLLAVHAAHLVRAYAVVALVLALARPRWRKSFGLLATAGCGAELYLLATTEISMRADGSCTSEVSVLGKK